MCIIHHNRPSLLAQALLSASTQDYQNLEIVLVDDGSTDAAALELLTAIEASPTMFSSRDLKVVRTSNVYLGAARNIAAKAASGEYLVFLDDDNYAKPNQVSTYVKVAQATGAVEVAAGHDVFVGDQVPTLDTTIFRWLPLGASLPVGLFKNCFGDANFFVQRQAFLEIGGFTEEVNIGQEDYEFHAKMALEGYHQEIVPDSLLYYRKHADQMLQTTDPLLNQMRSIRPYADAIDRDSVVRVIANRNTFAGRSLGYACNFTINSLKPASLDYKNPATLTFSVRSIIVG